MLALVLMVAVIAGAGVFMFVLLRDEGEAREEAPVVETTPVKREAVEAKTQAELPGAEVLPQAPGPGTARLTEDRAEHTPYLVPAGRSPIPQPGENLREPLPYRRLVPETPAPPPTTVEGVIPWDQAHRHVGSIVTVEGVIVRAHNTGRVCFLNFVPEHPSNAFYLIVFDDLLDAWPQPPQDYFLNKTIRATGQVHMHRGKPQIRIERKEQLEVASP